MRDIRKENICKKGKVMQEGEKCTRNGDILEKGRIIEGKITRMVCNVMSLFLLLPKPLPPPLPPPPLPLLPLTP